MSTTLPDTFVIPSHLHGLRIDQALSQSFPQYSRSRWGAWLKEEKISCNGKICKAKDKALFENTLRLNIHPELETRVKASIEGQDIPLQIIHEDEDILVINKPAGLVVHPGAGNGDGTLLNALLHYNPSAKTLIRAGIVHRLDKETTGLMVVAKTVACQTMLIEQLQARSIKRHYLALVYGHLITSGQIETFFGRHPKNRLKMAVKNSGREALTYYKINKKFNEFTLLDIELGSGRTHQIRVHMSHIRHPLVGDPLYGARLRLPKNASSAVCDRLKNFKRQALHAQRLAFVHPILKEPMNFNAPIPDDFKSLLDALETHYGHH